LKIAVDVDNVLADTIAEFCHRASQELHQTISKDQIRSPLILGSVPLSAERVFAILDNIWVEYEKLPHTEPNLSTKLKKLGNLGHEICIATSRPFRSVKYVKAWLELMKIEYTNFFALGGNRSKESVEADVLIDDDPKHIREFISSSTYHKGFLYVQPWNLHSTINKCVRIRNFDELLKYFNQGTPPSF
jgi:5'(3')-deoxyribonucleotidase